MNSHIVLTIEKKGELPIERERFTCFPDARFTADAHVEHGKYAAGVKRLIHQRPAFAWCYLNSKEHGPTDPSLADRTLRKRDKGPPLPMRGNPVGGKEPER